MFLIPCLKYMLLAIFRGAKVKYALESKLPVVAVTLVPLIAIVFAAFFCMNLLNRKKALDLVYSLNGAIDYRANAYLEELSIDWWLHADVDGVFIGSSIPMRLVEKTPKKWKHGPGFQIQARPAKIFPEINLEDILVFEELKELCLDGTRIKNAECVIQFEFLETFSIINAVIEPETIEWIRTKRPELVIVTN